MSKMRTMRKYLPSALRFLQLSTQVLLSTPAGYHQFDAGSSHNKPLNDCSVGGAHPITG